MNNIMKLAQEYAVRYRVNRAVDEARAALEAAVSQQAAEIEQLKVSKKLLEGAFDNKADELIKAIAERDALQAKLDELQRQEPVGFVAPHELKDLKEGFPITAVLFPSHKRTSPLYAAPKVIPLTDEQIDKGNAVVIEERMALAELCDAMGSPHIAEYLRAQAEIIRKEPTT